MLIFQRIKPFYSDYSVFPLFDFSCLKFVHGYIFKDCVTYSSKFFPLDKHFPPQNKLHKLFNRTNVKITYSCMPNMNSYTYIHSHKVLNDKTNETEISNCNCRNGYTSLLQNSCQTKCITY